jgi:segregation and condensation protein B
LSEIRIIEAALFSTGAPIGIEELKESTDLTEKVIKEALKLLIAEYNERETALEVAKVGDKYAMQLRPQYANHVTKFAEMEIPLKVLKTAALIAYHQPVRQRDLFDMVGSKVYDHVKILHELGLVRKREAGRTKMITTTERFSEYFGISTTDRSEIKRWLIEKLNVKLPEPAESTESAEDEGNAKPDEPEEELETLPDSTDEVENSPVENDEPVPEDNSNDVEDNTESSTVQEIQNTKARTL